jgi:hypothetical protein
MLVHAIYHHAGFSGEGMQRLPLVEEVAPRIRGFGFVLQTVRACRFNHFTREHRILRITNVFGCGIIQNGVDPLPNPAQT